jgi:hypothetical protein
MQEFSCIDFSFLIHQISKVLKMNITSLLAFEKFGTIKRSQYPEKLLLSGTIPAGKQLRNITNISHLGDFLCIYITGSYTTLVLDEGDIIDNGVCSLRGQLYDGTGNRQLFNDFIPFDLILSPGRIKDGAALNVFEDYGTVVRADPSQQVFYPMEFQHLFDVNSTIFIDVKNDSDADNSFNICFHGIRLLRGK